MDPTAREIATAVLDGSITAKWWFYVLMIGVSAVGAAIGTIVITYVTERTKGRISKEVWFAQESWKEKYRIYTGLIQSTEEALAATWAIVSDARVFSTLPPDRHSSLADGVRAFPEHQAYLDNQTKALERISELFVGAEVLLHKDATAAIEKLGGAVTRMNAVVNMSYHSRLMQLADVAAEVKVSLLAAARSDLRI